MLKGETESRDIQMTNEKNELGKRWDERGERRGKTERLK